MRQQNTFDRYSAALVAAIALSPFVGCGEKTPPPPTMPGANSSPSTSTTPDADAVVAQTTPPVEAKPTPPKLVPTPTAAQLEKWAIAAEEPWQLLACYDGFGEPLIADADVAADGKQFVLGGSKLTVWTVGANKPSVDLIEMLKEEVERPILCLAISPNGELLATGDSKGNLRVWKWSDQSEAYAIPAHKGRLTQLAFSPDSQTIATTSYDGEVRLWKSADGKKIKSIKADEQEVGSLAFLTDMSLATTGSEVAIWNTESGEKSATLTKGRVIVPSLGISPDRKWLAFTDENSQTKIWDVEKNAATDWNLGGAQLTEFSPDGKWLAALSGRATIQIWNLATKQIVKSIDAHGDRTSALKWLPKSDALLVASEYGRARLWGTAESAKLFGIEPIEPPKHREIAADAKRSLTPAQFEKVIDARSFPRLPGATPGSSYGGMESYLAPATQAEAEVFYRHFLSQAGWKEEASPAGMNFRKDGCVLNVSLASPSIPMAGHEKDLQVSLHFVGNYDARWLPKHSPSDSKATYSSFSSAMYRTKAELTETEVSLLKKFHEAGWVPYSRLNAASLEQPDSRSLTFVQGGSMLNVSIGRPGDVADELFVQTGVNVSNQSLPTPEDASWIEYDVSTDLTMVATTKMDLEKTAEFYDREMPLDGWIAREAGRVFKDDKAWLPYIRGQQDVLVRLATIPEGGTRILVGKAEATSWQLKSAKTEEKNEKPGVEAADFQLPKGASEVKYDVDQKQIEYVIVGTKATKIAEVFAKQMEALEWKRDGAGILGDDYSFVTYEKDKQEVQVRARGDAAKTSVQISGDGLLWTKPLPTAPVRISYETWLKRNKKPASLEFLDEFAAEMKKIPASVGKP